MASRVAVKEECIWWKLRVKGQHGCKALTELQCKRKGKCSFFETETEYNERQEDFKLRHGL